MRYALMLAMFVALGCQPEMVDMMEDGPMDGDRPDAQIGMPDGGLPPDARPDALRVNHMHARATVNSYHDVDHDTEPELMGYIHRPLAEQAGEHGIRFFDFDLIPDRRAGIELDPAVTDHIADELAICTTWYRCMLELAAWMDDHRRHALIVVLVGEAYLFATSRGLHFQLDDLEEMAVTAFDRERILSPAEIRGRHPSLRAAIRADGWPTIEETRGRIMFVLNDRTLSRERYLERGGLDADDRFLFLIGDRDDPESGDEVVFTFEPVLPPLEEDGDPWYFETDPADLERIRALAEAGYLVHGISDDPQMIEDLRAAGAHFVGTRFPDRLGPIPEAGPITCNPVTAPADCDITEIEPPL